MNIGKEKITSLFFPAADLNRVNESFWNNGEINDKYSKSKSEPFSTLDKWK